jgi:hypothetical protein
VPAVIEKVIGVMRSEWSQVAWSQYTHEFGGQPLSLGIETELTRADQQQLVLVREFLNSLLLSSDENDD